MKLSQRLIRHSVYSPKPLHFREQLNPSHTVLLKGSAQKKKNFIYRIQHLWTCFERSLIFSCLGNHGNCLFYLPMRAWKPNNAGASPKHWIPQLFFKSILYKYPITNSDFWARLPHLPQPLAPPAWLVVRCNLIKLSLAPSSFYGESYKSNNWWGITSSVSIYFPPTQWV